MPKFNVPTHYALAIEQVGKIQCYTDYAQAILTLIQNDSTNNEGDGGDEFFTSTDRIKTAISAVQHFLEEVEKSSRGGICCEIEQAAFKPNTEIKLKRIEEKRLQQTLGGNDD